MKHLSLVVLLITSLASLTECSKSSDEKSATGQNTASASKSDNVALEAKMKKALTADNTLAGCDIQVDASEKGAITLRGSVKTEAQIDRAKEIAMKEPSIKVVWSKLKVK